MFFKLLYFDTCRPPLYRILNSTNNILWVGLYCLQLENELEVRSDSQIRLDSNFTVELIANLLAYMESQSNPLRIQLTWSLNEPVELEQILLILFGDARACVDDFHLHCPEWPSWTEKGTPDDHRPSSRRKFMCIRLII